MYWGRHRSGRREWHVPARFLGLLGDLELDSFALCGIGVSSGPERPEWWPEEEAYARHTYLGH